MPTVAISTSAVQSVRNDAASESFAGLLLRYRGRIELTQRQLAVRVGVSARAIQDWEGGVNHASAESLQALLAVYATMGCFTTGRELDEAEALWTAAARESPRLRTPFDRAWFADLLWRGAAESEPDQQPANEQDSSRVRQQDWGDAPESVGFVGRVAELSMLAHWVDEERSRLVAVLGMGGIGKTTLASRFAEDLAPSFELVYWRSLRNQPSFREWLSGAIAFLSNQLLRMPAEESAAFLMLLDLLRERRCLLILDNFEMLLAPNRRELAYRDDCASFGRLLRVVAESRHQSCLVVTSREAPPELEFVGMGAARALELRGLAATECQTLLRDKRLTGDATAWATLVERFGGNGLALKIVGETIQQLFGGDITTFLEDTGPSVMVGGLRRLLESQMSRLSDVEQEVLMWLARDCDPVSLSTLTSAMAPRVRPAVVLEAVEMLRRRSLMEQGERAATFMLQSMVLDYMSTRFEPRVTVQNRAHPYVQVLAA